MLYFKHTIVTLFLVFCFSSLLQSDESGNYYFPDKLGSYWVYEDQDGKEFTRLAIEETEVNGGTFRAFSYEPAIEDWEDYKYGIHPLLYQVSDDWIAFYVGNDIENRTKSLVSKKLEDVIATMRLQNANELPPGISIEFDYSVEPTAQDYFYLLPIPTDSNDEWIAMQIDLKIVLKIDIQGAPVEIHEELKTISATASLIQTGTIAGSESVDTDAGTFDDCIKIEFKTKSKTDTTIPPEFKQILQHQDTRESISTIWIAPNVGIVKYYQEIENSEDVETLQLIRYEIKPDETNTNENN